MKFCFLTLSFTLWIKQKPVGLKNTFLAKTLSVYPASIPREHCTYIYTLCILEDSRWFHSNEFPWQLIPSFDLWGPM